MDDRANILKNFILLTRRRLEQFIGTLQGTNPPSQLPVTNPSNAAPGDFSLNQLDRPLLILGFCFTAINIAVQRVQNLNQLPITFHLVCLTLILSFCALSLSVYISRNSEAQRQVLQHVGVFFGATAFFFGITMFSPLFLKLISWCIFALSLLWIFLSRHV